VGRRACECATEACARVVLLPALPFGVNTNHLKVPGALACSLTPTTLLAILTDLTDALRRQGVRKLLLLNGHGGNELKPLTRELHHRTDVFLCVCDWYRVATDQYQGLFDRPGEHADEVETSLGLAFFPHLVRPELADEQVTPWTPTPPAPRFARHWPSWVGWRGAPARRPTTCWPRCSGPTRTGSSRRSPTCLPSPASRPATTTSPRR